MNRLPLPLAQQNRLLLASLVACLLAALLNPLLAQPASPHLGYVYPAGGQQGTTFQVVIGGQFLGNLTNAYVSGDGVQARFLDYNRPMNQNEFNRLRDRLQELQNQRQTARRNPNATNSWTATNEREVAEIRQKILKNPPNRQGNPALAETVKLEISLARSATPNLREIRLGGPGGLSNPMAFAVGTLPETTPPSARAPNPDLERFLARLGSSPKPNRTEPRITLPAEINGQIMPGEVDRYHFSARAGQRLLAIAHARALIPYLADAVPGWFQATLTLYNDQGKEVAYDDDFRFDPDPLLVCEIPQTGDYTLEIKDAIYRGREDFVYRITLGELPYLTSAFPLGAQVGETTQVELKGFNLPPGSSPRETRSAEPGLHNLTLKTEEPNAPGLPFEIGTLPECLEREPNNPSTDAQILPLPIVVNGRIQPAGDWDVFRFQGRAGQDIVAEIKARRLGSPLDSILRLTDAQGNPLASNDDHEDLGRGLETHHADSLLQTRLPADGAYLLQVSDVQRQGGTEFAYRLRLSEPQPDFELRIVPSSITLRGGLSAPLTVYALRHDGFSGPIQLNLIDAPPGITLDGGIVPPHQDQVRITLTATASSSDEPVALSIQGRADINSQTLTRTAIPADDLMQAFIYRHLVPAQELLLLTANRGPARPPLRWRRPELTLIPAGGTTRVNLGGLAGPTARRFNLELDNPPDGITLQEVETGPNGVTLVLRGDGEKIKPGFAGNLIIRVDSTGGRQGSAPNRPAQASRRLVLGSLPALPFEVVRQK